MQESTVRAGTQGKGLGTHGEGLGEILVREGRINQSQLDEAYARQREHGGFLGQTLVQLGHIEEETLTTFLVRYCRIPYLSLLDYLVNEDLLKLVPSDICVKYNILPIDKLGRNLTLAVVNPLNAEAMNEVKALRPELNIKPVLVDWRHFEAVAAKLLNTKPRETQELSATSLGLMAPRPKTLEPEPVPEPTPPAPPPPQTAADSEQLHQVMKDSMRNTYEMLARRVPLFRGLAAEEVANIFTSGMTTEVDAGTVIFEKGDRGNEMYVVMGGSVAIRDGQTDIAALGPGEMFGEMGLISSEPRSATAAATELTSLFGINAEHFEKLLTRRASTTVLMNIIVTLSKRIRIANERLVK